MSTETPIPITSPITDASPSLEVPTLVPSDTNTESSLYTYIFIGVLVAVLLLLLYYAYGRFIGNSKKKCKKDKSDDNADDEVLDFNLREAIRELQQIQIRVMGTLSEQSEI